MECYNYAGWGCAPHAPHYHPNYQNYYRYDYPTHPHHEHMHMDYSAYAAKEGRMRRALSRRDARHSPAQPIPLPHTPPLEHSMSSRGLYCEPQMWSHYHQMGMGTGPWGGMAGWPNRSCFREYMRYPQLKNSYPHSPSPIYSPDGRCTPYNMYESYPADTGLRPGVSEYPVPAPATSAEPRVPERREQPRAPPPEVKRPPVVPLPAFQQAFGSTEIGKFSEAFTRTEAALDDAAAENFTFENFPEWESPTDPQYQPVKEIKCEENY